MKTKGVKKREVGLSKAEAIAVIEAIGNAAAALSPPAKTRRRMQAAVAAIERVFKLGVCAECCVGGACGKAGA